MAVYTTRIEAEKAEAPVLLANGNLVASGDVPGTGRHFAVWHDPFPKPSYLFALVGGTLACVEDHFRTMSGRDVTLRIYVEPGKEPRCPHAMDSLKRAMRWDETAFGREYDLDIFMIVAVSDFNMGAMENKGLNVFNDKYVLASPETATDSDYDRIEAIIAHEYFHNWTGNRITCRDWFQLCLKEGLTVFRDQEFTADERSRAVERISDVRGLRAHQFVEDAGPLAHPVRPALYHEINNFYTATVYEKGAEVVRMLQTLLGPENFRRGMDLYFARHDGEAATVEQFVQCFADVSGVDLDQFMLWYSQAGTPEVVAAGSYDARAKTYRLDLAQTVPPTPGQPSKEPMVIPLAIGLVGRDGRDLPLALADGRNVERGVLTLTRAAETFVFADIDEAPVPSLNRGFSAPIKLVAEHRGQRPAVPRRARHRPVQSLAGSADARHTAPGRQCRDLARRRHATPGCGSARRTRRDRWRRRARAGIRCAHADASGRGGHCARDRPRRRSRCHLRGAHCIAGGGGKASRRRRCSIITAGCPRPDPTGPTRRASAGARCATPASIFWSPPGGRTPSRSPMGNTRQPTT